MDNRLRVFVFFFGIFASSFLVQIGDAIPSSGKKRNSLFRQELLEVPLGYGRNKDQEFYATLVEPLVEKCADEEEFAALAQQQKVNPCAIGEELRGLFMELNDAVEKEEKAGELRTSQSDYIRRKIYLAVRQNVVDLEYEYMEILDDLNAILATFKMSDPKAEFKQYVQTLIGMSKSQDADKKATAEQAYKVLYMGIKIDMNMNDKREWAFRQFAANLAVFSLDFPGAYREFLQALAEDGMKNAN